MHKMSTHKYSSGLGIYIVISFFNDEVSVKEDYKFATIISSFNKTILGQGFVLPGYFV